MYKKIQSLEDLNKFYVKSDSIRDVEIDIYREKSLNDERKIVKLKRTRRTIGITSGVGGILLFILGTLI